MGTEVARFFAAKKKDIVLVDDDPVFCNLMASHAKLRGIELDYYLSLAEMDSIASFRKYHVAIVDYRLEHMTGLEVAEYFPVFFNEMPVMLISGTRQVEPTHAWPQSVRSFVCKEQGFGAILDAALALKFESIGECAAHAPRRPLMMAPTLVPPSNGVDWAQVLDPIIIGQLLEADTQTDDGFLTRLFTLFVEGADKARARIHTGLAAGDYIRIVDGAHRLKGSAYNLGAGRLAAIAGDLEVCALLHNLDQCKALVTDLDAELAAAVDAVGQVKGPGPEVRPGLVIPGQGFGTGSLHEESVPGGNRFSVSLA